MLDARVLAGLLVGVGACDALSSGEPDVTGDAGAPLNRATSTTLNDTRLGTDS